MNPQIVLNFNLATETEKFTEGQTALETSDVQSLPTPLMVTASISETAVAFPTPMDYAATVSDTTSGTLPTPFSSEATQSDTNITLPTPMDTMSDTLGITEQQGVPTPMNAITTASAATKGGGIPTPFDNIQESAASISEINALPEPTGSDFHSNDKELNAKRKMK